MKWRRHWLLAFWPTKPVIVLIAAGIAAEVGGSPYVTFVCALVAFALVHGYAAGYRHGTGTVGEFWLKAELDQLARQIEWLEENRPPEHPARVAAYTVRGRLRTAYEQAQKDAP